MGEILVLDGQEDGNGELARFKGVGYPELVQSFLARMNANTWRARERDLKVFSAWLPASDTPAAARAFLGHGRGHANKVALAWKEALVAQDEPKLSSSTINRRLTSLRALAALAGRLGLVDWTIDVENVPHEDYRDTRGPEEGGFRLLLAELHKRLAAADQEGDPRLGSRRRGAALRDLAILHLLYGLALRRAEVRGLNVEHVDFERGLISVLRKGKTDRTWITLPEEIAGVLLAWLAARGEGDGPLFVSYDPVGKGDGRLAMSSVTRLVQKIGKDADLKVWPHALRHAAITELLRRTRGNIQVVQKFAGHSKPETTMRYDDNRKDLAGEGAKILQRGLKNGPDEETDLIRREPQ